MKVTIPSTKEKTNLCPVSAVLELIGGKWKPIILYCLRTETRRFGEIAARIPSLSRKVLTDQLKELEQDQLIIRVQYNEIPPRVEYSLSPRGKSLAPLLEAMEKWGNEHVLQKQETTTTNP
ncbi:transcriptional regulator, HxlR family [Flavobacterium fontis]|jgi:DNA-binding HxlR family transcriptional regulator|uniref:Transcriptional regulator, HxlR family n=1 Tax=Flavobacterium fontis TaxID=1124188 RepID=A0A1M5BDD3_9FLAO|nr:helix-turn-helix domain-containing protein [Flavobacterium fontis]SHF40436.1 transcriptional regulator, HxlR family [Flavobacterium fontis]